MQLKAEGLITEGSEKRWKQQVQTTGLCFVWKASPENGAGGKNAIHLLMRTNHSRLKIIADEGEGWWKMGWASAIRAQREGSA